MEAEGQRVTSNPQAALAALVTKRERLQEELRLVEKQVYDLETSYLHDSSQCGNVLRGFEGFLSSTRNTAKLKNMWLGVMGQAKERTGYSKGGKENKTSK